MSKFIEVTVPSYNGYNVTLLNTDEIATAREFDESIDTMFKGSHDGSCRSVIQMKSGRKVFATETYREIIGRMRSIGRMPEESEIGGY